MGYRKAKRKYIKPAQPNLADSLAAKAAPTAVVSRHRKATSPPFFQAMISIAAFAIVFSHRPDALLNAQFYAEDGWNWYPDAYQFGLRSFLMPVAGYLHLLIRSVAFFSLLFPLLWAPLIFNLCAIVIQILPVNVFLSSRFSQIPLRTRLLGSFLYLALPNNWEIHANITNVQWHLVLLACLILLSQPPQVRSWRIFDGIVLVVTSVSSPIGILLVPMAAALWRYRQQRRYLLYLAMLVPGALVESLVAVLSHSRQLAPNGATLVRFVNILGRQIFFSSLLGWHAQTWLVHLESPFAVVVVSAALGLILLFYAMRHAPLELRLFILFAFAVLALGLLRPLAGPPVKPQWEYLCMPGRCTRYFFMPMMAFLATLMWLARRKVSGHLLRPVAIALLFLMPIGIFLDWSYPAFEDLHFSQYAAQFERAPVGTKVSIPINPTRAMELTKR